MKLNKLKSHPRGPLLPSSLSLVFGHQHLGGFSLLVTGQGLPNKARVLLHGLLSESSLTRCSRLQSVLCLSALADSPDREGLLQNRRV